jgi:hypothetical protein
MPTELWVIESQTKRLHCRSCIRIFRSGNLLVLRYTNRQHFTRRSRSKTASLMQASPLEYLVGVNAVLHRHRATEEPASSVSSMINRHSSTRRLRRGGANDNPPACVASDMKLSSRNPSTRTDAAEYRKLNTRSLIFRDRMKSKMLHVIAPHFAFLTVQQLSQQVAVRHAVRARRHRVDVTLIRILTDVRLQPEVGPRPPLACLVDDGACRMVASTIVPVWMRVPWLPDAPSPHPASDHQDRAPPACDGTATQSSRPEREQRQGPLQTNRRNAADSYGASSTPGSEPLLHQVRPQHD